MPMINKLNTKTQRRHHENIVINNIRVTNEDKVAI